LTFAGSGAPSSFGGTIQDALDGGASTTALVVSSGTLTLTGSNVYTGGTSVTCGLLEIASAGALPSGTSLTIGAGAGVVFDAGASAGGQSFASVAIESPAAVSSADAASVPSAVPMISGDACLSSVPEPSTLTLLGAGAAGLVGWAWRRRRQAA
jgi:autotransporter-associated beta strand protein